MNKSTHVRYIRRRKRIAAPVFGLWLFLLFSCVLASYYFIHSPYFSVQHIKVLESRNITEEDIIKQSGLKKGNNIFKVNLKEAASKINVFSWIEKVEINRRLPSTLLIRVHEREPLALVVYNDEFIIVDKEGIYIKKVKYVNDMNLPLVTSVPITEKDICGAKISAEGLHSALSLIQLLDNKFLEDVAEIIAPSSQSLTLKTLEGIEIRFGEPKDLDRKIHLIENLLEEHSEIINSETVEYIDLRYDTTPVFKIIKRKK